MAENLHSRV